MGKGLIHSKDDDVCVVVADVKQGEEVVCSSIEDPRYTVVIKAINDIPLGHKIALRKIGEGNDVKKYGRSIGVATKEISLGEHVHVHNIKSKRWGKR
ncbi:dehydratase [Sulfolobales archaeon HS-7]|nr:dehydratase [Sulfolobales archaeon HS-7]